MAKYLLLILAIFAGTLTAQNNYGGLDFSFKKEKHEKRTSLLLTNKDPLPIGDKITLSFDLSFEDPKLYGYIAYIYSKVFSVKLLYKQSEKIDTSLLQIILNDKAIDRTIAIPKKTLKRNSWQKVTVRINPKDQTFTFKYGRDSVITNFPKPADKKVNIIFGAFKRSDKIVYDIPQMCIRQVKIFDQNERLIHYWKLDELDGLTAKDAVGKLDAPVTEPVWKMENHYLLKKMARLGPFELNEKMIMPAVAFEERNQRIICSGKNFLYYFYLNTKTISKVVFNKPLKHNEVGLVYDSLSNNLYSYFLGLGRVSVYDEKQKSWSDIDTTGEHDGYYYGHNSFINPLNGGLYSIFGYGWYKVNNTLHKYDFKTQKWNIIPLKGDFIPPRSGALIGAKNQNGEFFILGGEGNNSGKQEETYRRLNDIYLLDLKDSTVKKIDVFMSTSKIYPHYPSLHYDSLSNKFFFYGMHDLDSKNRFIRIYSYDLKNKLFEAVSDSVIYFKRFNPVMFFNKTNNEYLLISAEQAGNSLYVDIYSAAAPLLSEKTYNNLPRSKASLNLFNGKSIMLYLAVLFFTGVSAYYVRKKYLLKNKSSGGGEKQAMLPREIKNSIYLFGGFRVVNSAGKEVASEFTPKVKQLFLLLIFKTFNGNGSGLSTDSLSVILWPDMSPENVKNNRNVTLNKLRHILAGLDSIEIKNEKNHWEISFSENIFCDYLRLRQLLNSVSPGLALHELEEIKEILSRGELAEGASFEWLDGLKVAIIDNLKSKLKKEAGRDNVDKKSLLISADSILLLDPLDEEGLALKIKTHIELNDQLQAKRAYDLFKKEYFKLYAEEYTRPFDSFLE